MSQVTVVVPHNIDPALAKANAARLVEAKLKELTDVQDFQMQWAEHVGTFHFKVFRLSIQGTVEIEPKQIVVNVHLPLVAAMFKGRIRKEIAAGITQAVRESPV